MKNQLNSRKQYLLASDFDQTLSFNDSGQVLAEMLGISNFQQKVAGLTRSNLMQLWSPRECRICTLSSTKH